MTSSCSALTWCQQLLQGRTPGGLVLLRALDRVDAALLELGHGHRLGIAPEHDVGTTTGHVRRHRDGAPASGLGDDRGLPFVVLRVEHLVRHAALAQQLGQVLGLGDAGGANEHRLAVRVFLDEILDDGGELGLLGAVHEVGLVGPDHVLVRRDRHDTEVVDLVELGRLGHRRAGHTRRASRRAGRSSGG